MAKRKNKNKGKGQQQPEPRIQTTEPEPETEEDKKGYVKPDWFVNGEFTKVVKADFGYSLQGKIDFCDYQIAFYNQRKSGLVEEHQAKNDPKAKLRLAIQRRRQALQKDEKELKALEQGA